MRTYRPLPSRPPPRPFPPPKPPAALPPLLRRRRCSFSVCAARARRPACALGRGAGRRCVQWVWLRPPVPLTPRESRVDLPYRAFGCVRRRGGGGVRVLAAGWYIGLDRQPRRAHAPAAAAPLPPQRHLRRPLAAARLARAAGACDGARTCQHARGRWCWRRPAPAQTGHARWVNRTRCPARMAARASTRAHTHTQARFPHAVCGRETRFNAIWARQDAEAKGPRPAAQRRAARLAPDRAGRLRRRRRR